MNDKQLQTLLDDVAEIKRAVKGEPATGNTGLVKRVAKVENKLRAIDLRIASVAGGVAVGIWALQHFFK